VRTKGGWVAVWGGSGGNAGRLLSRPGVRLLGGRDGGGGGTRSGGDGGMSRNP